MTPGTPVPGRGDVEQMRGSAEPTAGRRMLLITPAFPPESAVGALRWQKFAAVFAEHGIALDVVMHHPRQIDAPDWSRLNALPSDTRVFGVAAPEPRLQRVHRLLLAGRNRLRRPAAAAAHSVEPEARPGAAARAADATVDRAVLRWRHARIGTIGATYRYLLRVAGTGAWSRAAAAWSLELTRRHDYAAVITSGPPHEAHAAGVRVARITGLPFVMDMRDPWSLNRRIPSQIATPLYFAQAGRAEARAVRAARFVLANTGAACERLQALYPRYADRIITVMNGSDDDPLPPPAFSDRFVAAFAGSLYMDRNPVLFFRAAAAAIQTLGATPAEFGVELMGHVASYGGAAVADLAAREGIGAYVALHPPGPRAAALDFLARAPLLFSLLEDLDDSVPAKIYEYVRFPAWLLILARADSANARLLRGTTACVLDPLDVSGMTAMLVRCFRAFRAGERPTAAAADGRFSRRVQAERLVAALGRLSAEPAR